MKIEKNLVLVIAKPVDLFYIVSFFHHITFLTGFTTIKTTNSFL